MAEVGSLSFSVEIVVAATAAFLIEVCECWGIVLVNGKASTMRLEERRNTVPIVATVEHLIVLETAGRKESFKR
jgi:uncharacterized membrane protein